VSNRQWFKDRLNDPYLKRARREDYRSRAAYKLTEILDKYRFIKKGMNVLDIGAAPGSWSQVAREALGPSGRLVAVDLLPIQPIEGVTIFQGDIRDPSIQARIAEHVGTGFHVILSDMAPDTTGIHFADTEASAELVHLVLDQCERWLRRDGAMVAKVFEGQEYRALLQRAKQRFSLAKSFSPKASLSRSREVFLVAQGFKGTEQQPPGKLPT